MANERCLTTEPEIRRGLQEIWQGMQACVRRGCDQKGCSRAG